jgi:hypothetical protein
MQADVAMPEIRSASGDAARCRGSVKARIREDQLTPVERHFYKRDHGSRIGEVLERAFGVFHAGFVPPGVEIGNYGV